MAISFPPECDTPLKRLTFSRRVHRRLLDRHQQKRAEILTRKVTLQPLDPIPLEMTFIPVVRLEAIEIDDPEQWRTFKQWEREIWISKIHRCNLKITEYKLAAKDDAEAYQIKLDQQTDTTWDYAIDPDTV